MSNISITGETWTKVSDATDNIIVLQPQQAGSFQYYFGEPTGDEATFICKSGTLVLNNGTLGEELWVYFVSDVTLVAQGVV